MRLFTSLTAIALLAVPALGQHPRLASGPASLLSAPPVYGPASGTQTIGSLVPTSEGWIAVWSDYVEPAADASSWRIFATRLRPDGVARDIIGVRITSTSGYASYTAVPDPLGARIFWVTLSGEGQALHTVVVDDDGHVSDEIVVSEYPEDIESPSISAAAIGSRYAVLLGRYLTILDGARQLRLHTVDLGGDGNIATVIAAGSHFVVTWVASGGILMRQTLDLDGAPLGPPGGMGVASPAYQHTLASNGTSALLAWGDATGIRLSVIDPESGQLTDKGVIGPPYAQPRAVWTGSSYLVVWQELDHILPPWMFGVRVSADGTVLDQQPQPISDGASGSYYVVAARGAEPMMLFQSGFCGKYSCDLDVYARTLGSRSADDHLISATARSQTGAAVASDGSGFLAIWNEGVDLLAAETTDRARAPSLPIALGEGLGSSTSVTSDGDGYLVSWTGYRDGKYFVQGAALKREGDALTRRAFALDPSHDGIYIDRIAAAASPGIYLVVWRNGDVLEAVRARSDGELLDSAPRTIGEWGGQQSVLPLPPSIAFDGEEFVVSWFSTNGNADVRFELRTVRVSLEGIARFDRIWSSTPETIEGVSIDCADGTCLLVWAEKLPATEPVWHLVGQRFQKGGDLVDSVPFEIGLSDGYLAAPAVAWDGHRFVVTWKTYDSHSALERTSGRSLPSRGPVAFAAAELLAEREIIDSPSATTCNDAGRCIVIGAGSVDDAVLGRATRLFKRFFGEARHRGVRR